MNWLSYSRPVGSKLRFIFGKKIDKEAGPSQCHVFHCISCCHHIPQDGVRLMITTNQEVWDKNCDAVVERANLLKFGQNASLKEVLLATGRRQLVETNPKDRIWGVGFDSEHAIGREAEWGQNRLGHALMRVREQLRKDQE